MQKRIHRWVLGAAMVMAGVAVGLWIAAQYGNVNLLRGQGKNGRARSRMLQDQAAAAALSRAFARVAEEVTPAVVTIHSLKIFSSQEAGGTRRESNQFQQQREGRFRFGVPRRYRQEGTGSGVIISPDGYILTNYHVIHHAQKIDVTLTDYRTFPAKVVGADRLSEVAVIKVDAENLPYARLGNSDSCRVGELVLAIGNPLDLKSTVTMGIISARGRRIDIINDNFAVEYFLQTDAAINPGNSGGALVNLRGEVIGINAAIATETGYDMGFGFAIPANLVRKISADLIRNGEVVRGYLGIALQNIEELQARALHLEKPMGVFVDDVFKGSPAAKAGIRMMDVILEVDGKPVNRANMLQAYIAGKLPGEEIEIKLLRGGRPLTLRATLGRRQSENPRRLTPQRQPQRYENLGMELRPLTEFDSIELGYPGTDGALVTAVKRFSPAERVGIREDDVITGINEQKVHNPADVRRILGSMDSGEVAIIKVYRASGHFHYFVEIP